MTAKTNTTVQDLLAKAAWIQAAEDTIPPAGARPAYEFRTKFTLDEVPWHASLAVTAHGIYEAFINGFRVGDEELSPGLSSYAKTLYVQDHEVTGLLSTGLNELRLVLSDGWFRGRCGPSRVPDNFGTRTALIAQLEVQTSADVIRIATGPDWEYGTGPITAADLMDGQTVDFTRAGNIAWQPVRIARDSLTLDRSRLSFSPAPPVRRVQEYAPTAITKLPGGRQIVDFGQNLNGWVRLSALGPAGTRITLTHGEALDRTGDLTTAHLAYTQYPDPNPLPTGQTDTVISRGNSRDVFEPRHTTHGFRYVAVDGLPEDLNSTDIAAILVHTDLAPTGTFDCSDELLNQLHRIAKASWRANACDVPTDCPQRERWGYTGDYQIFVRSAAFLDDVYGFSRKWLKSLADDQLDNGCITNVAPNTGVVDNPEIPLSFDGSAGWGDAATIVPWQLYVTYGDARVLKENFDMMTRWVNYAARIAATQRHQSRQEIRPNPAPHERFLWDSGFHWGEWAEPGGAFDFAGDKGIVATAYMARSSDIVSRAAAVLGRNDLAHHYRELHTNAVNAWRTEYLTAEGHLTVESQANYVRGFAFGLIPAKLETNAVNRLVELIRKKDTHLSTGFLSTPFLLPVLADHGRTDTAYELLFQDTAPSWMTMLNRGATTIWESWEGISEDGIPHESLNHYSKGAVITFLHEYIAGIRPDENYPGYEQFSIEPKPGHGLRWARATMRTARGTITSSWHIQNSTFTLDVRVPAGCTAQVVMPSGTRYTVGHGNHTFTE
ncbi:family 78 glycoside hydrolase catalytic domain [Arthrobacter sp. B1I2]|uniref:family 78 glycoside hydrolase catalytic domain n=1 Tax=Arthrobacter sp. B1I2 TaxID=3042263 RepID=UPI0027D7F979|nr:family 78 glycoside hydrolase catalytic domain [Arthrobacter sp. B1I2]